MIDLIVVLLLVVALLAFGLMVLSFALLSGETRRREPKPKPMGSAAVLFRAWLASRPVSDVRLN